MRWKIRIKKCIKHWWAKSKTIQRNEKTFLCHWSGRSNILMAIQPKQSTDLMHSESKYSWYFSQKWNKILKFTWNYKRPRIVKAILGKQQQQSWSHEDPRLQTVLSTPRYDTQNFMVLAQKLTPESIDQNRDPSNKPKQSWPINLWHRRRQACTMEKRSVSSTNVLP